MEKFNEKAVSEADKTLELLYKKEELIPDPYFFTRIEGSINENESWNYIEKFKLNYLIPIFLIMFLLFNFFTLYKNSSSKNYTGSTEQDSISTFIRSYHLSDF